MGAKLRLCAGSKGLKLELGNKQTSTPLLNLRQQRQLAVYFRI